MKKRHFMCGLSAGLIVSLVMTGCGSMDSVLDSVKPGETISSDSKWINSDIENSIDETTVLSEKDDFHAAVNRDWFLETEVTEDEPEISIFTTGDDILYERMESIL